MVSQRSGAIDPPNYSICRLKSVLIKCIQTFSFQWCHREVGRLTHQIIPSVGWNQYSSNAIQTFSFQWCHREVGRLTHQIIPSVCWNQYSSNAIQTFSFQWCHREVGRLTYQIIPSVGWNQYSSNAIQTFSRNTPVLSSISKNRAINGFYAWTFSYWNFTSELPVALPWTPPIRYSAQSRCLFCSLITKLLPVSHHFLFFQQKKK